MVTAGAGFDGVSTNNDGNGSGASDIDGDAGEHSGHQNGEEVSTVVDDEDGNDEDGSDDVG